MLPLAADRLYPLFLALGAVVGIAVFVWRAAAAGVDPWQALLGATLVSFAGLAGGRIYWLVEQHDALTWASLLTPGFRHPGIVVGVLVTAPIVHRLLPGRASLAAVLDCAAPAVAFAFAVGRVGCFLAGCCFGIRSNLPWAMAFPPFSPAERLHHFRNWASDDVPGSLPVHPLQLYFLLLALGVGLFLLWYERRKAYDGQLILLFLAVHESGKFLLEQLREPDLGGPPSWVPAVSLVLAVAAWATLLAYRLRHQRAGARLDVGTPRVAGSG